MKKLFLLPLLLLAACVTAPQPTQQDPNAQLGEGDKYIVGNLFDSLGTAHGTVTPPADNPHTGGTVTMQQVVQNTDGSLVPLVDKDGNPVYITATGIRNFTINYGSVTQTVTGSGTTSGSQDQAITSTPTSTPTGPTTNPEVTVPLTGQ